MPVIVLKENGKTLEKSFDKIFKALNFVVPKKVFIKPNFSGRPPLIPGENTDPEFLKIFIKFLISEGAEEVFVGHGALLGVADKQFPFDKMIDEGGFSFLRTMPKVTLMNLDDEEKEIVNVENVNFAMPKILKNVDAYINLAKLKAHMETAVSLSLKNQMGLVSPANRMAMHRGNLENLIACIGKLAVPTFSIVEGIIAMEGNGPHHGNSRKTNLLAAGNDMVELDSVISYLIGLDFKNVGQISRARELGVGNHPSEKYLLDFKKYKISDFKPAIKCYRFLRNLYLWPTSSCSCCITTVNECGKIIKSHPIKNFRIIKNILFSKKKINIVIGKGEGFIFSNKDKNIFIGLCTKSVAEKNNAEFLNKCPPNVKEVWEIIKKELNK